MKILIDIGHPGHVHLFRNFAFIMQEKGHDILFTCREKEFEIDLIKSAGFKFISFGKKFKSLKGKVFGLFIFNFKMFKVALKFKPDIFLSVGSMYAAQVSFLFRKPHIAMEDTGNMEQVRLYLPFTEAILTPKELIQDLGKKQIKYNSFHELAYLGPNYFTPNSNIYDFLKIKKSDKYVLLRFVSWNASHDIGQGGLSDQEKDDMIEYLSENYKVLISSEANLPEKHKKFLFKIPPDKIHDVMAFADLVVSEGATMASESGVLGTPAIYVNSLRACNNEDQEKYRLVYNFRSGNGVLDKIKELEKENASKVEMEKRKLNFLSKKIDITALLVWFVEEYPKSKNILINDSNYQFKFKLT